MNSSISQVALVVLFQILSIAVACAVARYPRKATTGLSLGVVVGVVLLFVTSGVAGFIGNILPLGQIDFWLASLFSRNL
jgi:hypothetical protein